MFLDCPWNSSFVLTLSSSSSLGQQHNSYHFISDDNSHHRIKQFRFLQKESSSSCIVSPAILWANIQTFLKNISQRTNKSVLWDTYLYKNVKNAGFALVWLRPLPPRMAKHSNEFDALFMLRSSVRCSVHASFVSTDVQPTRRTHPPPYSRNEAITGNSVTGGNEVWRRV